MKRNMYGIQVRPFLFVLLLWCPTTFSAQEKEYDKFINEFDVGRSISSFDNKSPEFYWDAIFRYDESLFMLYDAVTKNKKSAREAQADIQQSLMLSTLYISTLPVVEELQSFADSLLNIIGAKKLLPVIEFHFIDDNDPNAFTYPNGKIFFHTGLLKLDISLEGLIGICAHEATHFMLQHSLQNAFAYHKKLKQKQTVAGIASVINAMSAAYAAANGVGGGEETWSNVRQTTYNLFEEASISSQKYRYKYSRGQEIEADIHAYRFLEWSGIGGIHYIKALKSLLSLEDHFLYSKSSGSDDHPTTEFRIGLLEYLYEKDHKIKEVQLDEVNENELDKFYDELLKKGFTEHDLGDRETFPERMRDKKARKRLYDWAKKKRIYLGSYSQYEKRFVKHFGYF